MVNFINDSLENQDQTKYLRCVLPKDLFNLNYLFSLE